jgi:hypothetical protein
VIVYSAHAEIYDPAKGTFGSTGTMHANRWGHTATLLNDGRVLIAGGYSFVGSVAPDGHSAQGRSEVLSSAELYTPAVLVGPPVLLSLSGDGKGQGAILHAGTHQVVSSDNPANAGESLEIYLTGLTDGSVIPPQVAIGGRVAEILFCICLPAGDPYEICGLRICWTNAAVSATVGLDETSWPARCGQSA